MWSSNDSSILNLDCKTENRYGCYAINGDRFGFHNEFITEKTKNMSTQRWSKTQWQI